MSRTDSYLHCQLQPGVFSRSYSLYNGRKLSVAYHTPSKSISIFEDDSAEVWTRLFEAGGDPRSALGYIIEKGTFSDDPFREANETLAGFIERLRESRLLVPSKQSEVHADSECTECSVKTAVSPVANMELSVGQLMADHRILYNLVLELTYRCNERCVHCYLPEDTRLKELTLEQIDGLLGEFASMGGFMIQLTGGEPFTPGDEVSVRRGP